MNSKSEHPIKAVIEASMAEVASKGTEGASDKAVLMAGIGYLAEMLRNDKPRTRRELVFTGFEKGGPWAVAVTLLGYLLTALLGGR